MASTNTRPRQNGTRPTRRPPGRRTPPAPVTATRDDWKNAAEPLTTITRQYIKYPVVGTLLLGAFLVLKGYVLAKGDIPIALGILHNAGAPTVVIGGLLSGLPILVAAMLTATIFNKFKCSRMGKKDRKVRALKNLPLSPRTVVLLATIVLSLIVTPWPFIAAAALVGFVMAASYRAGTRDGFLGVLSVTGYLATLSIAVYAVIVMLYSVWLPHEKLTITGVNPSPVGYVLSDDPDGWITILLSRQHGIVSYRDTEVTNQQICESAPYNNWSQLTNATTVWQEITKLGPLTYLHPAVEPPCFKPRSAA